MLERSVMDKYAILVPVGLVIFIFMQVLCHLGLKYASTAPRRYIPFFILGNGVGLISTCILIWVYRRMNANIAMGLGIGVSFMLTQIALAILFKSALSWPQWLGIVLAASGLFLLAFFSVK
ncbi:MAG: hypothetical protein JXA11_02475 [Phycisphaerae bacterium]|nr:hypothetical protein [Phycisphaerae bacterium]